MCLLQSMGRHEVVKESVDGRDGLRFSMDALVAVCLCKGLFDWRPGCRCSTPLALAPLGVRGVQAREQNKPGDEWREGEQREKS